MNELIEKIRAFRVERDWDRYHSPKNLVMALSVEVAELMEHFQWLSQAQSAKLSADKLARVKEEIGDIMIYLANLADKLDIDLLESAHDKLEINRRKYPAARVAGKALKYDEYE